ncbi:CgeB family protein [Metabacillus fastidiosus]|uniref:CgeB family protein n=1 Tax=Metabacillus fastidiosus TaxID=1458 RepID=UPI003D2A7E13
MKWFYLDQSIFTDMIVKALRNCGQTVQCSEENENAKSLKLKLETFLPEVILTSGWNNMHTKANFEVIKKHCKIYHSLYVHWSFEDPVHTETWGKFIIEAGSPNYVFTHDYGSPRVYEQLGIPSSYLPFAFDPDFHYNISPVQEYTSDISLIATYKPWIDKEETFRMKSLKNLLLPLLQNGFNVNIWGPGWIEHRTKLPFDVPEKYLRGPIEYKDISTVFCSSKINLGIQNGEDLLTQRTFECLASGGFLLTDSTAAVQRHFINGEHLVASNSAEETVALANYYLNENNKRQQISMNGQNYVVSKDTYAHRIEQMIDTIKPYVNARSNNPTSPSIQNEQKHFILRPSSISTTENLKSIIFTLSDYPSSYIFLKINNSEMNSSLKCAKLKLILSTPLTGKLILHCRYIQSEWSPETVAKGYLPRMSLKPMNTLIGDKAFNTEYEFDITAMLKEIMEANYGVAIQPSIKKFQPILEIEY